MRWARETTGESELQNMRPTTRREMHEGVKTIHEKFYKRHRKNMEASPDGDKGSKKERCSQESNNKILHNNTSLRKNMSKDPKKTDGK